MNIEKIILNQIPEKLYITLTQTLPRERNKKKQLEMANKAIKELDVEDFTPYIVYDDNGDIYVCMKHHHNGYELDTIHASGKHDVSFGEDGIYVDCDAISQYLYMHYENINANIEAEKQEALKYAEKIRKANEIEQKVQRLGDYMQYLQNYIFPYLNPGVEKENVKKEIEDLDKLIICLSNEILKEVNDD